MIYSVQLNQTVDPNTLIPRVLSECSSVMDLPRSFVEISLYTLKDVEDS